MVNTADYYAMPLGMASHCHPGLKQKQDFGIGWLQDCFVASPVLRLPTKYLRQLTSIPPGVWYLLCTYIVYTRWLAAKPCSTASVFSWNVVGKCLQVGPTQ